MSIKPIFLFLFFVTIAVFFAENVFAEKDVPPIIVTVSPEYGQKDVDTGTEISIVFNCRMQKKSVEKNLQIFPYTQGKFSWEKNKLIFKPDAPLLACTDYYITFNFQVKGDSGLPLTVTYFTTTEQALYTGVDGMINIVSKKGLGNSVLVKGNNAVWSADNRTVVYEEQGQIWKIGVSGENCLQLTNNQSFKATKPVFNILEKTVVFIGIDNAGIANLYKVDVNTKMVRQLTSFFTSGNIENVKWSQDMLYLAFLRAGQIWVMNGDGKDLHKITTEDVTCTINFAWSPGGTKIAFNGKDDIWIGDIYSLELEKISFTNFSAGVLDWSEKNEIVFESDGLIIMDVETAQEKQIFTAGKRPQWINTGEYLSFILPLFNGKNTAQIWVMHKNGLNKQKLGLINLDSTSVCWSKKSRFFESSFSQ